MTNDQAQALGRQLVEFLETGIPPQALFTEDVFCDFTSPRWRMQAQGIDGVVALRKLGHPGPGKVPRWRCDPTPGGFVLEFEERWFQAGHDWYSREMARADVELGSISVLCVYCTGDWDEARRTAHAAQVKLLRP